MFDALTGDDIFNRLMMQRQLDSRTFVLVEGDRDLDALAAHIDDAGATAYEAGGKINVVAAVRAANSDQFSGVLGIVDRDLDGIVHPLLAVDNLVYTDDADLDATIMFSETLLARVVRNHAQAPIVSADLAQHGLSMVERLVEVAAPLGMLRALSVDRRYEVKLATFPVSAAIKDGREIDIDAMCRIAHGKSPACPIDHRTLATECRAMAASAHPRRKYCRGHDLADCVRALVSHWGGKIGSSRDDVERIFRSAFSGADLAATELYRDVCAWATENKRPAVWSV